MGGESTGCRRRDDRRACSRSALFDPLRTAATGRRLGIESDARTRFERGVDPALVLPGTEYATRLILELCGGEASAPIVAGRGAGAARRCPLPASSSWSGWPGIALRGAGDRAPPRRARLRAAGWARGMAGAAAVLAPRRHARRRTSSRSWCACTATTACRRCRCAGPRRSVSPAAHGRAAASRGRCAARWPSAAGRGGHLVVHRARAGARCSAPGEPILKRNPINAELSVMRPTLLPNLVSAAARNQSARAGRRRACSRSAPRFFGAKPGEQEVARPACASAAHGRALGAAAAAGRRVRCPRRCAGGARRLRRQARERCGSRPTAPRLYHPGPARPPALGPQTVLAEFGELHPASCQGAGASTAARSRFELVPRRLPKPRQGARAQGAAGAGAAAVPAGRPRFRLRGRRRRPGREPAGRGRAASTTPDPRGALFDVYAGPGLGEGRKSLAVAVRLQAADHTLTEAEIEAVADEDRGRRREGDRRRAAVAARFDADGTKVAILAPAIWRSRDAHDVGQGCARTDFGELLLEAQQRAGDDREERQAGGGACCSFEEHAVSIERLKLELAARPLVAEATWRIVRGGRSAELDRRAGGSRSRPKAESPVADDQPSAPDVAAGHALAERSATCGGSGAAIAGAERSRARPTTCSAASSPSASCWPSSRQAGRRVDPEFEPSGPVVRLRRSHLVSSTEPRAARCAIIRRHPWPARRACRARARTRDLATRPR